jgi:hypothetical protein
MSLFPAHVIYIGILHDELIGLYSPSDLSWGIISACCDHRFLCTRIRRSICWLILFCGPTVLCCICRIQPTSFILGDGFVQLFCWRVKLNCESNDARLTLCKHTTRGGSSRETNATQKHCSNIWGPRKRAETPSMTIDTLRRNTTRQTLPLKHYAETLYAKLFHRNTTQKHYAKT